MSAQHLEVLVEEPSIGQLLSVLLPTLVGQMSFTIHEHQGKPDLLQKLPDRMRGYARWLPTDWRILVVVDRDSQDCLELKRTLEDAARAAGFATRTSARGAAWQVVNRIAIEELEAWYFGDWKAVRSAYPRVAAGIPRQAAFREPDQIAGGTWEAFERVLRSAGYFSEGLRKVEAARVIAAHLDPRRNTSPSFRALHQVLQEIAGILP